MSSLSQMFEQESFRLSNDQKITDDTLIHVSIKFKDEYKSKVITLKELKDYINDR